MLYQHLLQFSTKQQSDHATLPICFIKNLPLPSSKFSLIFTKCAILLLADSDNSFCSSDFSSTLSSSLSVVTTPGGLSVPKSCSICVKVSATLLIVGRSFRFFARQLSANLATLRAVLGEKWFPSPGSIILLNLRLSAGCCFAQSNSCCSCLGRCLSSDRLPVRISYSTTPKLHTSLLEVRCPVSM